MIRFSVSKLMARMLPRVEYQIRHFKKDTNSLQSIKQILDQEIEKQLKTQHLTQLNKLKTGFEQKGWQITTNGIQIQLSHTKYPYNMKIFFNIHRPQQLPITPQAITQRLLNTFVTVSRAQSDKHLIATYLLTPNEAPVIINIEFASNINRDKKTNTNTNDNTNTNENTNINKEQLKRRKSLKPQKNQDGYQGPIITGIDENLYFLIHDFIQHLDVNEDLFNMIYIFAQASQQSFYIQWLKDMRSLV